MLWHAHQRVYICLIGAMPCRCCQLAQRLSMSAECTKRHSHVHGWAWWTWSSQLPAHA